MRRFFFSLLAAVAVVLLPSTPSTAANVFASVATAPQASDGDAKISLGVPADGAQAKISYAGATVFTCTDFTAAGTGTATLDRDNTGVGNETARIDVTDGDGTLLYTLTFTNPLGAYPLGLIGTTPYATAPTTNPLRIVVTSLAGNSLPALVGYAATGTCAGLPTFAGLAVPVDATWALATLAALLLFAASSLLTARR